MTKKKKRQPLGQTIGGILYGFEQQVLRTMPPGQELAHHARPDDPVPAGDGGLMTIELPDVAVLPSDAEAAAGPAPTPAADPGADDPR